MPGSRGTVSTRFRCHREAAIRRMGQTDRGSTCNVRNLGRSTRTLLTGVHGASGLYRVVAPPAPAPSLHVGDTEYRRRLGALVPALGIWVGCACRSGRRSVVVVQQ